MIRGLPVFGPCQNSRSVALAKRIAALGTRKASSILDRGVALGMTIRTTTEKFEFLSIGGVMVSRLKAVRVPLTLLQLTENLELSKEQTYEATFRAEIVQKNDCPCILLTGFGFVSCLNKGIAFALH